MTATAMLATPAPPPGIPPGDAGDPAAGTLAVANAALRGGFVLLPRTLLHAPGLSRDAKLLYAVLLSYAWQRGSCFPGYERLQADLQCGINQVTKYLRELEGVGLITRRRRGLGKTTLYTLHDPPPPPKVESPGPAPAPDPERPLIHRFGESEVTETVNAVSPLRRHKQELRRKRPSRTSSSRGDRRGSAPGTTSHAGAPPSSAQESTGAGDDDALLGLLISQGITPRIAQDLVRTHSREAIAQQVAWQPYRPAVKSPAGALVQAIRDAWPPPAAWQEAQAHAATVARQAEEEAQRRAEDEARRREWAAKPPEQRIAGRLQFWLLGQRHKGREPAPAEVAAKRAELLAGLDGPVPGGSS